MTMGIHGFKKAYSYYKLWRRSVW